MLDILTLLLALLFLFLTIFTIFGRKKLSRYVSVKDLGIIEKDFPKLIQVVVLADRVEKPTNTLADAVEDNFKEGVKYLFLVSASKAEKEINGYYLIFEALAKKVSAEKGDNNITAEKLVKIKNLSYDWPDVPYIFYQFQEKGKEQRFTIAYRGNQKNRGISDYYEKVSPTQSKALVSALLSEAPVEIKAKLTLVSSADLLQFPQKVSQN